MTRKDWFLLVSGIFLGVAGVIFYFFPYLVFPNFNEMVSRLTPAVKGAEADAWSEDWTAKKYVVAELRSPNTQKRVAIGVLQWEVRGQLGDKRFVETWTVGEDNIPHKEDILNALIYGKKKDWRNRDIPDLVRRATQEGCTEGNQAGNYSVSNWMLEGNTRWCVRFEPSETPENNFSGIGSHEAFSTIGMYSVSAYDLRGGHPAFSFLVLPRSWHVEGHFE